MRKYRVVISDTAALDIENAIAYIIKKYSSPIDAFNWLEDMQRGIESLSIFPDGHQILEIEPWQSNGFRTKRVRHHRIVFKIDEENLLVIVVMVKYSRVDFSKLPLPKMR